MGRIIEAGHYYVAKGPTIWSLLGWSILEKIKKDGDKTLLFTDNVHTIADVSPLEVSLENVDFHPEPDFVVEEAAMAPLGLLILERLKKLPGRKRAKKTNGNRKWYCSGFPITNGDGKPTCVLLDAGLTLFKKELGFSEGVNILPYFYAEQQKQLLRLIEKAMPDFQLRVILYDQSGKRWTLPHH